MQSLRLGSFQNLLSLFGLVIFFTGCQGSSSDWNSSEPFKTQIVSARTQGTEFKIVELQGVYDQRTLSGEVVDFYFSPGESGGKVLGQAPIARFVKNSRGVHVPADMITLQMVTIYFHLQELKALEIEAAGREIVGWPRKVGLQVITEAKEMRYNNAYYNSQTDMLYFVPYKNADTPIALNKGVIAHEHFHSYFTNHVIKPAGKQFDIKKYEAAANVSETEFMGVVMGDYVLKALNEGLADFWGWVYSDDPDFVALSLPGLSEVRSLNKLTSVELIPDTNALKVDAIKIMQNPAVLCPKNPTVYSCVTGKAYQRGTTIARVLKEFAYIHQQRQNLSGEETRALMAQKLLGMLEQIQFQALNDTLTLESTIVAWSKMFNNLSELECKHLANYMTSAEEKQKICAAQ